LIQANTGKIWAYRHNISGDTEKLKNLESLCYGYGQQPNMEGEGNMKNSDLAEAFVSGTREGMGSNMFIEGRAIYSYGRHFPIAVRFYDEIGGGYRELYLFNSDGYSHTTAVHKSRVLSAIGSRKIIYADTDVLKKIIDNSIFSFSDVKVKNIQVKKGNPNLIEDIEVD